MKLRYRLTLAFLLFAVLPLTAITVYSYRSSTRALRRAVEEESRRTAREMEQRMGIAVANLTRRMGRIESVPFPAGGQSGPQSEEAPDPLVVGRLVAALGDAAEYVESFEFSQPHPNPEPQEPPAPGVAPPPPPLVFHVPRMAGGPAGEPAAGSLMAMAGGILSDIDDEDLRIEIPGDIGERASRIATLVMEQIKAENKKRRAAIEQERAERLKLKQEFSYRLRREGEDLWRVKANVDSDRLLREVLSQARREENEIPFARDASGKLFTPNPADLPRLRELAALATPGEGNGAAGDGPDGRWIVVTHEDPASGLAFGIAHPVGASLEEIRRTSARNLLAGLGVAALALFGIVPVTRRMTRNLSDLTHAADRLAAGDLDTRVTVRSRDEIGTLALTFNRMAHDLGEHQERRVEQERLRKELELCRKIQTELLPRRPLSYPFAELQGVSIPARELGGDFFNYFDLPGGGVALLMGDVSGKGVPAALLMANVQATLKARLPLERDLAVFTDRLDHEIEANTPAQVYLTLFMGVLDPARRELRYINAGHESPFLRRGDGRLERLEPTGRPVGLLPGGGYTEVRVTVEKGDHLFLYTDGLIEAENEAGAEFGTGRLAALLRGDGGNGPADLLARVERAYREHRGRMEAPDDAALLMLRVGDLRGVAGG